MFDLIKKLFIRLLASVVLNIASHTNAGFNLLLLIYVLMNKVKNYTTIYLQLN